MILLMVCIQLKAAWKCLKHTVYRLIRQYVLWTSVFIIFLAEMFHKLHTNLFINIIFEVN